MAVNGENLTARGIPAGGIGDAYVYRPDGTALRLANQGVGIRAARLQREALAKRQREIELGKAITENLKYDLGTDQYHGSAIREQLNAKAVDELKAVYSNPNLDDMGKRFAAAEIKQKNDGAAKMGLAYQPIYNGAVTHAFANKNIYNPDAVAEYIGSQTNGKLPSQVDPDRIAREALAHGLNDQGITDELVKTAFPSRAFGFEDAGVYGGKNRGVSGTFNGLYKLAPGTDDPRVKNADGTYALDLPTEKLRTLDQGNYAKVLDKDMAAYEAKRAADPTLPALDRDALSRMRLASYADAGYGVKYSQGLNAQRTRDAASKTDKTIYAAPTEEEYKAGGTVELAPGYEQGFVGVLPDGTPAPVAWDGKPTKQQQGFVSGYAVAAPLRVTSSGEPKRYSTGPSGIAVSAAFAPDEKGNYTYRTNLDKPLVGEIGDTVALPLDANGKPIAPENKAAYEAALRNPKNGVGSFTQLITPTNKNFSAVYNSRLDELKKERDRQIAANDETAKRTTVAQLEDKAYEAAAKETVIQYIPNTGQNARALDRLTGDFGQGKAGSLRAHREGLSGHLGRVRGSQPAARGPLSGLMNATPVTPGKKAW